MNDPPSTPDFVEKILFN